ncbi:MAG: NADP oxidoreductase [Saprospiraceae bacterium]|nr:NADP oxidoreductase [Saprospiraceae bacterium]
MNRTQTLDALWSFQRSHGYLTDLFVKECAKDLGISTVELEGVISFYHFFRRQSAGEFTIYINNSIVSECKGYRRIKSAFERETGATLGQVDPSGKFGLFETPCIGLSDQEPAALINFFPFTNLTTLKVKHIVAELKKGTPLHTLSDDVPDHLRYTPPIDKSICIREYHQGRAVLKLANLGDEGVIEQVKLASIKGMGGAYFPTGLKMEACRSIKAEMKYVVCNADEGEPGTFKDRVLMNKYPGLLLEGMIASGYAVGAREGIIYLRAEYYWMMEHLRATIQDFYKRGFLGKSVAGIIGFDFDIRVQLGAGSYVCGEETALLNSMEGKRGEPRTKQFYPTERGFLNQPTLINNVETLCAVGRVVELGAQHFLKTGTKNSPGTKLLSISGDCHLPGIYEIEWGTKISDILNKCQADDPYYIQISGPSGVCLSKSEFDRSISMEDVKCGGSFMIFNSKRDILSILQNFTAFFKHESCGVCTPCRAGNYIIERKLIRIANGLAYPADYEEIKRWGEIMRMTSRCGLGQAATNTLSMAIDKFPEFFAQKVDQNGAGLNMKFNMEQALQPYERFKD